MRGFSFQIFRENLTKGCIFPMALMTLYRTFVFEVMARNTDLVRNILAPSVNNTYLGLVAIEAIVMHICLVFPMLEPEVHYPHLKIYDFRPKVFRWFSFNCCKGNASKEDHGEGKGNDQGP